MGVGRQAWRQAEVLGQRADGLPGLERNTREDAKAVEGAICLSDARGAAAGATKAKAFIGPKAAAVSIDAAARAASFSCMRISILASSTTSCSRVHAAENRSHVARARTTSGRSGRRRAGAAA